MIFEESIHARWNNAGEDILEMIADAEPKGHRVQLLRSFGKPALKRGGDAPRVIMTEPKRTKPDPELFHFVHLAPWWSLFPCLSTRRLTPDLEQQW